MQLTSIVLILSAAVSASAFPSALWARASNNTASLPKAEAACGTAHAIIGQQFAEMANLKEQKIPVPAYLAGYYTAINSGRQEIGCPGSISVGKREETTALKDPCDVIDEQHERMQVLVNRFESENIPVAPFIAGFLSATLDGHEGLKCPPFTGPATEAAGTSNAGAGVDPGPGALNSTAAP